MEKEFYLTIFGQGTHEEMVELLKDSLKALESKPNSAEIHRYFGESNYHGTMEFKETIDSVARRYYSKKK